TVPFWFVPSANRDSRGPAADRDPGHDMACQIDPGQRAAPEVAHPDRTGPVRNPSRLAPDGDRRRDVPGRRVDHGDGPVAVVLGPDAAPDGDRVEWGGPDSNLGCAGLENPNADLRQRARAPPWVESADTACVDCALKAEPSRRNAALSRPEPVGDDLLLGRAGSHHARPGGAGRRQGGE